MSARIFLDTNILIYAIENDEVSLLKTKIARSLVARKDWIVSTQVLGEFYRATTSRRRVSPLIHDEAVAWVQLWKQNPVCSVERCHVDLALELCGRFMISYYDALVLSVARLAGCTTVFSEDLNGGQDYGGIVVENPFCT